MTRTSKLLMTTGAAALAATVLAGATLADGRHDGRGHQGGAWLFERFDANDLVDLDLRDPAVMVRLGGLGEFDANGDGNLSLEEYQALWLDAMRERMVDHFQAHDDDGDGLVTAAEFGEPFAGIVSRLDDDGDGELTRDELRRRHHDRDRDGDRD